MKKIYPLLLLTPLLFLNGCAKVEFFSAKSTTALTPANQVEESDVVEVTASRLNLRECGSTKCATINQLVKGDQLLILQRSIHEWVEVEQVNGSLRGWVSTKYVKKNERTGQEPIVTPQESEELLSDELLADDSQSQPTAPVKQKRNEPTTLSSKKVSTPRNEKIIKQPLIVEKERIQPNKVEKSTPAPRKESAPVQLAVTSTPTTKGDDVHGVGPAVTRQQEDVAAAKNQNIPAKTQVIENADPGISDEFM